MFSKGNKLIGIACGICICWFILAWNIKQVEPSKIAFISPEGWPKPYYNFEKNTLSQEGFELGKKLFFDGSLSKDGNFACASCHQQFGAFNNYEHVLSHGYNNQLTKRNAPGLFNLAWQKNFMWDGSINNLDEQYLMPLTAHNEMAENIDSVIQKLKKDTTYLRLFTLVFGKQGINKKTIGQAFSQFLVMLVSNNSKYDRVMNGKATFTQSEQEGYEIFKQKCNSCHTEPLFTDNSFRNTGLMPDYSIQDFGRMDVTKDSNDFMKFRVPSLRNLQVTFPYGHDGRFYRLYNVIEHYRTNLVAMPNTDSLVKYNIPITNYEVARLTAFLQTLTDSLFLSNKKFVPDGYTIDPNLMHVH
jgi:cytochrome c peroxidase